MRQGWEVSPFSVTAAMRVFWATELSNEVRGIATSQELDIDLPPYREYTLI